MVDRVTGRSVSSHSILKAAIRIALVFNATTDDERADVLLVLREGVRQGLVTAGSLPKL